MRAVEAQIHTERWQVLVFSIFLFLFPTTHFEDTLYIIF